MPLLSNYAAVDLFRLRGSSSALRPCDRPYSTYQNRYFIAYSTLDGNGRQYDGLHASWNVHKNGIPSASNIRQWTAQHEHVARLAGADLIVVSAEIRRTDTDEATINWTW